MTEKRQSGSSENREAQAPLRAPGRLCLAGVRLNFCGVIKGKRKTAVPSRKSVVRGRRGEAVGISKLLNY